MNNYNNLKNTLSHEEVHQEDVLKSNGEFTSTFVSHAGVYLKQLGDESFSSTTTEFKTSTIGSFSNYLMNEYARVEGSSTSTISGLIDSFNALKTGYTLTLNNQSSQYQQTTMTLTAKDGTTYTLPYKRLENAK